MNLSLKKTSNLNTSCNTSLQSFITIFNFLLIQLSNEAPHKTSSYTYTYHESDIINEYGEYPLHFPCKSNNSLGHISNKIN